MAKKRVVPTPDQVLGARKIPSPDEVLKKKDPTNTSIGGEAFISIHKKDTV